jgi:acyl-homoserine lactone acylase PvdQ
MVGDPHIRARSVHDLFVAQEFVHAMDRRWQMDAARKQREGRWAEWVGVAGQPAGRPARRLRLGAATCRETTANVRRKLRQDRCRRGARIK